MSNDLVITTPDTGSAPAADNFGGYGSHDGAVASSPGRKAEIERIRDTDIDRYFSEKLDKELLQIMKEERGETLPTDPMDVGVSHTSLMATPEGRKLVSSLESMGGFRMQLQRLQNDVGGLVRSIGDDRRQRAFMERFDRDVPESVRYAIYEAIAHGPPTFVMPVSDGGLKDFAESGAPGPELVSEWGRDAAENVARIWRRVERLREDVGEEAMARFRCWFDDLSAEDTKQVLKFMVGRR